MLFLCNKNDQLCIALYSYLQCRDFPVQLVTDEQLICAKSWEHSVDEQGSSFTRIVLRNGYIIESTGLRAVFNRIRYFFMQHFINPSDRNYAEMEIYALYSSFLLSINHILIEPVETRYLTIQQDNTLYYFQKAIESNLPVIDYHFTSSPRQYSSPNLNPTMPSTNALPFLSQHSPFLIWQNQPTLFLQPFRKLAPVYLIGQTVLGNELIPFESDIRDFAKNIRRNFFELLFAETKQGIKMYHVNIFPLCIINDIIKSLADLMIAKYKKSL